jgi:hypothetical protein
MRISNLVLLTICGAVSGAIFDSAVNGTDLDTVTGALAGAVIGALAGLALDVSCDWMSANRFRKRKARSTLSRKCPR